MANTIFKSLLLALAAGSSVQAMFASGVTTSYSSTSSSSSSQFSYGNLMQEISVLPGIASLTPVNQQAICGAISGEYTNGVINFVDVMKVCGSECAQNTEAKSNLISFLTAAQQKTNAVQIVFDTDYLSAFRKLSIPTVIKQINPTFYQNYGFCANSLNSVLAKYLTNASTKSTITIDINEFSKIFGELFVKTTVAELQAIIRALFQQVGCYSNIVFTQPKYAKVDVPSFMVVQNGLAKDIEAILTSSKKIDLSLLTSRVGQVKTRYSGCNVCASELDSLLGQISGMVQSQVSVPVIAAQATSIMRSFSQSASMTLSSGSTGMISSGCSSCSSF